MKRSVWFAALAAMAASCNALAVGDIAQVTIIDCGSGVALTPYWSHGEYWVAGRPGATYAIEIHNRLGERLLAVTSVDGVNVVSGDTAAWDQTGYVFGPRDDYRITGWRKSDDEVAAFTFTAAPNSYAARTGRPANVGVIGVAVFREQQPPQVYVPPPPPVRAPAMPPVPAPKASRPTAPTTKHSMSEVVVEAQRSTGVQSMQSAPSPVASLPSFAAPAPISSAQPAASRARAPDSPAPDSPGPDSPGPDSLAPDSPAPDSLTRADIPARTSPQAGSASTSPPAPKLGTGHGEREYSHVDHTEFERLHTQPDEVIRIRYDSLDNLVAMGIVPTPHPVIPAANPFPASAQQQYVPDPPAGVRGDLP
jgi:hypothetical protein